MDYIEYKNTVTVLKDILGLSCIEHWDTDTLHPYTCIVLGYLCRELSGKECQGNLVAIKELCGIIDTGNEVLLEDGGGMIDFKYLLGIPQDEPGFSDTLLGIAWANVTTSLWAAAKCNYAGVLWELEHQGCGCPCGCGDEPESSDNLYSKLIECGAYSGEDDWETSAGGCGCGSRG